MRHATSHSLTITMVAPRTWLTINWRRRNHWSAAARHTKAQRQLAMLFAYKAAREQQWGGCYDGPVVLDVEIRPYPRAKRLDATAVWEALKPTIDGIEDTQLIVANDKQIVPGTIVWSSERTGLLLLTLTREDDPLIERDTPIEPVR